MTKTEARKVKKFMKTAALTEFEAMDLAKFGPVPSREEWLKRADEDYPTVQFAAAVLTKTKAELVEMARSDITKIKLLFEAFSALSSQYKDGSETLDAVIARLMIAGSVVAEEEAKADA